MDNAGSDASTHVKVFAPYLLLEHAEQHYSAALLDMHSPAKSKGKVFSWNGKTWTCTGSIGKSDRLLEVHIREVIPVDRYSGPPNDPGARGPDYYLGGKFICNGQAWVMTGNVVTLVSSEPPTQKPKQLILFT